MSNRQLKIKII